MPSATRRIPTRARTVVVLTAAICLLLLTETSSSPAATAPASKAVAAKSLTISPPSVKLVGNFVRTQLVVSTSGTVSQRAEDLTPRARFISKAAEIVRVSPKGTLSPRGNGSTRIVVTVDTPQGPLTAEVPVRVSGFASQPKVAYTRDVLPVISKAGCNMGSCHAAQYGQSGFKACS
jgi:hypothetical protein